LSQRPVPGTRSLSRTRSGQLQGPLFGLAPDGVCLASSLALRAVVSYTTFSPLPRFLRTPAVSSLLHFPSGRLTASPPACIFGKTEVTRHRALRSSDFPPPAHAGSDSPPFQNRLYYTEEVKRSNDGKTPNTKHQAPEKLQIPKTKQTSVGFRSLVLLWSLDPGSLKL